MKSRTYSFSPTTSEQSYNVYFVRDNVRFRPAAYTIKNLTDQKIKIKLLSLQDNEEILEYPSEYQWFEIHPDKEYTILYSKYFDTIVYLAAASPSTGTLDLSVLDFEMINN